MSGNTEQLNKPDEKSDFERHSDMLTKYFGYVRATPGDVERRKQNYTEMMERILPKIGVRVRNCYDIQITLAACEDRVYYNTHKDIKTKMCATRKNLYKAVSYFHDRLTWELLDKFDDHKLDVLCKSFIMFCDWNELKDMTWNMFDRLKCAEQLIYYADWKDTLRERYDNEAIGIIKYLNNCVPRLNRIMIFGKQFVEYSKDLGLHEAYDELMHISHLVGKTKKKCDRELILLINSN